MNASTVADLLLIGAAVVWVLARQVQLARVKPRLLLLAPLVLAYFGIQVEISTSTDDALEKVDRRSYDLIISDMGRPPDARAGYTLLDKLRQAGNQIPLVIYANSRTPEHVREARAHGAIGCTNRPQELIEMVTTALSASK